MASGRNKAHVYVAIGVEGYRRTVHVFLFDGRMGDDRYDHHHQAGKDDKENDEFIFGFREWSSPFFYIVFV